jgi:hypothetical protein
MKKKDTTNKTRKPGRKLSTCSGQLHSFVALPSFLFSFLIWVLGISDFFIYSAACLAWLHLLCWLVAQVLQSHMYTYVSVNYVS